MCICIYVLGGLYSYSFWQFVFSCTVKRLCLWCHRWETLWALCVALGNDQEESSHVCWISLNSISASIDMCVSLYIKYMCMYVCVRWFIQLQLLTICILLRREEALFLMFSASIVLCKRASVPAWIMVCLGKDWITSCSSHTARLRWSSKWELLL